MRIKWIIFDLGGVFIDMTGMLSYLADVFEVKNKKEFWDHLNKAAHRYCLGKETGYQYWKNIADAYGKKIDPRIKNLS